MNRLALLLNQIYKSDAGTVSFWISQGLMIFATIIGVFLAGKEGLTQALMFDEIKSTETSYHLRGSLRDEVLGSL